MAASKPWIILGGLGLLALIGLFIAAQPEASDLEYYGGLLITAVGIGGIFTLIRADAIKAPNIE